MITLANRGTALQGCVCVQRRRLVRRIAGEAIGLPSSSRHDSTACHRTPESTSGSAVARTSSSSARAKASSSWLGRRTRRDRDPAAATRQRGGGSAGRRGRVRSGAILVRSASRSPRSAAGPPGGKPRPLQHASADPWLHVRDGANPARALAVAVVVTGPEPPSPIVLTRLLAAGIDEDRAHQQLAEGVVLVDREPITDPAPDLQLPRPRRIVTALSA